MALGDDEGKGAVVEVLGGLVLLLVLVTVLVLAVVVVVVVAEGVVVLGPIWREVW